MLFHSKPFFSLSLFYFLSTTDVTKQNMIDLQNIQYQKDDPLSSLDNEVSKWIFDNSIKNMLLKHQRTVILVTQKTHLVHNSDYVNILLVKRLHCALFFLCFSSLINFFFLFFALSNGHTKGVFIM